MSIKLGSWQGCYRIKEDVSRSKSCWSCRYSDSETCLKLVDSLSHTITLIIAFRQGNHISLDTFGDLGPSLSLQFPICHGTVEMGRAFLLFFRYMRFKQCSKKRSVPTSIPHVFLCDNFRKSLIFSFLVAFGICLFIWKMVVGEF